MSVWWAGAWYSGSVTTKSGWPSCQPSGKVGAGGRSAASPSGAPAADQRWIRASCSGGGRRGDQRRAIARVRVGEQAERGGSARPVAGRALLEQNRSDVFGEGRGV